MVLSWQACACRYVRESKVLFKVSGYADKALAGGEGAVSPHTPGGPHGAHSAPTLSPLAQMLRCAAMTVIFGRMKRIFMPATLWQRR